MSHEIETMAFFQETPWHGLGTALQEDDLYDWQKTCEKAGLAWDVELVPLVTSDIQATVRCKAVRRTSDSRILGEVGPRFFVLQNRDAVAQFQPFLDAKEVALHTAGSLRQGSHIWLVDEGHIASNPAQKVKEVRRQALAPKGLERSQVRRLLREVELRQDVRAAAVFSLLLYTGSRVSDLVNLELADMILGERSGSVVFRFGKGNKQRSVPLPLPTRS